jgi:hypothetical protein
VYLHQPLVHVAAGEGVGLCGATVSLAAEGFEAARELATQWRERDDAFQVHVAAVVD